MKQITTLKINNKSKVYINIKRTKIYIIDPTLEWGEKVKFNTIEEGKIYGIRFFESIGWRVHPNGNKYMVISKNNNDYIIYNTEGDVIMTDVPMCLEGKIKF